MQPKHTSNFPSERLRGAREKHTDSIMDLSKILWIGISYLMAVCVATPLLNEGLWSRTGRCHALTRVVAYGSQMNTLCSGARLSF